MESTDELSWRRIVADGLSCFGATWGYQIHKWQKANEVFSRFSQSISSTQLQPLRPASTSSRYVINTYPYCRYRAISYVINLEPCPCPTILLHGRQMPRLLHHHHCLLTCSHRRHLRWMLDRPVSANWWKGKVD